MGLDNGIRLIVKHKIDIDDWEIKPDYVRFPFDVDERKDGWFEYEVCYWRKCWDVRRKILDILAIPNNDGGGIYRIEKPSEIYEIREVLIDFLRKPERWSDSIWSLDEYMECLAQQIVNLGWLYEYMHEHKGKNIKVEFYDSY